MFSTIKKHQTLKSMLLVVIFYLIWKPSLVFIFPGILLVRHLWNTDKHEPVEKVVFSILLSISYWVVAYWLTSIVPITLTNLINTSLIIFVSIHLKESFINKEAESIFDLNMFRYWSTYLTIFFSLIFIKFAYFPAPSGGDPATHLYIAEAIIDNPLFPKTFEPLIPIQTFGKYPIGYSLITALIAIIGETTSLQAYSLLVFLSFTLLTTAIYAFARFFVKPEYATTSTLLTTLIGPEILHYSYWGGVPYLLSVSLILAGATLALHELRNPNIKSFSTSNLLISLLFASSFAIHQIPTAIFLHLLISCAAIATFQKRPKINQVKFVLITTLLTLLASLPSALKISIPNKDTFIRVKQWQIEYSGTISDSPISIYSFFPTRLGIHLFAISLGCLIILFFKKSQYKSFLFALIITIILLIMNKDYWLLPLSPLLYPDRIMTFAIIILVPIIGLGIESISNLIFVLIRNDTASIIISISLILLTNIDQSSAVRKIIDSHAFTDAAQNYITISDQDMEVFNWINKNLPSDSIIENQYGDASTYLPILAKRKVIDNDAGPHDFEEINKAKDTLKPTHAFIGNKYVYDKKSLANFEKKLTTNPKYTLLFQSGKARIYKISESFQ